MTPIFINCRDRLTCLSELVDWFEKAGCEDIFLIDNDSTYPPLLEYYKQTPHKVFYLQNNLGHTALWDADLLHQFEGFYVYTDPDVIPTEDCPTDVLQVLAEILKKYPTLSKAGLGLKIDDLPDHYRFKENVLRWEKQFWQIEVEPGLFSAPVDTTFALNRVRYYTIGNSVRTNSPYLVRHADWYIDSDNLTEEERYYRAHARPGITHWNADTLPGFLK